MKCFNRMHMNTELQNLLGHCLTQGHTYTYGELSRLLQSLPQFPKDPGSYCYNLWQKTMLQEPEPFFAWKGDSSFIYLGPGYPYHGPLYEKREEKTYIIGYYNRGDLSLLTPHHPNFNSWKGFTESLRYAREVARENYSVVLLCLSTHQRLPIKLSSEETDPFEDSTTVCPIGSALGKLLYLQPEGRAFEWEGGLYRIEHIHSLPRTKAALSQAVG